MSASNWEKGQISLPKLGRLKLAEALPDSAPVEGEPVWDVYARWLRRQKRVRVEHLDLPRLAGDMQGNPGIAYPRAYGI